MPVALGDFFRLTADLIYKNTDHIQNVFYFRNNNGNPINDAGLQVAAGEVLEDIYASLVSYISEEVDFNQILIYIPTGNQSLPAIGWPTYTAGTATGDVTAPGVCHLAYARTGIGRSIGKKFFGAFSESNMSDGLWTSAQNTVVNTAAQKTWGTFVTSTGLSLTGVVYDRAAHQGRGAQVIVTTNVPAYQRRRRQGRGI